MGEENLVFGSTVKIDVVPVLTNAGIYSSGDFVGTSRTSIKFPNALKTNRRSGTIMSAALVDGNKQSVPIELWLFSSPPLGLPDDNAPFSIADGDAEHCIGVIPFTNYYAASGNSVSCLSNLGIAFHTDEAINDFYGALVTRGTPTYGNRKLSIHLVIVQD